MAVLDTPAEQKNAQAIQDLKNLVVLRRVRYQDAIYFLRQNNPTRSEEIQREIARLELEIFRDTQELLPQLSDQERLDVQTFLKEADTFLKDRVLGNTWQSRKAFIDLLQRGQFNPQLRLVAQTVEESRLEIPRFMREAEEAAATAEAQPEAPIEQVEQAPASPAPLLTPEPLVQQPPTPTPTLQDILADFDDEQDNSLRQRITEVIPIDQLTSQAALVPDLGSGASLVLMDEFTNYIKDHAAETTNQEELAQRFLKENALAQRYPSLTDTYLFTELYELAETTNFAEIIEDIEDLEKEIDLLARKKLKDEARENGTTMPFNDQLLTQAEIIKGRKPLHSLEEIDAIFNHYKDVRAMHDQQRVAHEVYVPLVQELASHRAEIAHATFQANLRETVEIGLTNVVGQLTPQQHAYLTQLCNQAVMVGLPSNPQTIHRLLDQVQHARIFQDRRGNPLLPSSLIRVQSGKTTSTFAEQMFNRSSAGTAITEADNLTRLAQQLTQIRAITTYPIASIAPTGGTSTGAILTSGGEAAGANMRGEQRVSNEIIRDRLQKLGIKNANTLSDKVVGRIGRDYHAALALFYSSGGTGSPAEFTAKVLKIKYSTPFKTISREVLAQTLTAPLEKDPIVQKHIVDIERQHKAQRLLSFVHAVARGDQAPTIINHDEISSTMARAGLPIHSGLIQELAQIQEQAFYNASPAPVTGTAVPVTQPITSPAPLAPAPQPSAAPGVPESSSSAQPQPTTTPAQVVQPAIANQPQPTPATTSPTSPQAIPSRPIVFITPEQRKFHAIALAQSLVIQTNQMIEQITQELATGTVKEPEASSLRHQVDRLTDQVTAFQALAQELQKPNLGYLRETIENNELLALQSNAHIPSNFAAEVIANQPATSPDEVNERQFVSQVFKTIKDEKVVNAYIMTRLLNSTALSQAYEIAKNKKDLKGLKVYGILYAYQKANRDQLTTYVNKQTDLFINRLLKRYQQTPNQLEAWERHFAQNIYPKLLKGNRSREQIERFYEQSFKRWILFSRGEAYVNTMLSSRLVNILANTKDKDLPAVLGKYVIQKAALQSKRFVYYAGSNSIKFVGRRAEQAWQGYSPFVSLKGEQRIEFETKKAAAHLRLQSKWNLFKQQVKHRSGYIFIAHRLSVVRDFYRKKIKEPVKLFYQTKFKMPVVNFYKGKVVPRVKKSKVLNNRFTRRLAKFGSNFKRWLGVIGKSLGQFLKIFTVVSLTLKLLKRVAMYVTLYLYSLFMWLAGEIGALIGAAVGTVAGAAAGAVTGFQAGLLVAGWMAPAFPAFAAFGPIGVGVYFALMGIEIGALTLISAFLGSAIGATIGALIGYAIQHFVLAYIQGALIGMSTFYLFVGNPAAALGGMFAGATGQFIMEKQILPHYGLSLKLGLSNFLHGIIDLIGKIGNAVAQLANTFAGMTTSLTSYVTSTTSAAVSYATSLGGIAAATVLIVGIAAVATGLTDPIAQSRQAGLTLTGPKNVSNNAAIDYNLSATIVSCNAIVTIENPIPNNTNLTKIDDPIITAGGTIKTIEAIADPQKITWKVTLTNPICNQTSNSSKDQTASESLSPLFTSQLSQNDPFGLQPDFCQGANPNGCSTELKKTYEAAAKYANIPAAVIAGIGNQEWKATFKHTDAEIKQWSQAGEKVEPNGPANHPRFINGCALSFAYAEGPMQFLTGKGGYANIWASYSKAAVDAGVRPAGYTGEACNVLDAVFGASKKLKSNSGIPFTVHKPYWEQDDVYSSARAYLGACVPQYNQNINYCEGVWQYYRAFTAKEP